MFTTKDFINATITGFTTGLIAWRVLEYLDKVPNLPFSAAWLMLIIPVLWIIGVNLGYFLGRWMPSFNQFGKFAAIGFTNFAVDLGAFNLLFVLVNENTDWSTLLKAGSFVVAATHSYFWNKYWSFNAASTRGGGMEFFKFITVSVMAMLVNVGIFTLVVNGYSPDYGFSEKVWLNLSSIVGSASALIFSFVGFRLVVFTK